MPPLPSETVKFFQSESCLSQVDGNRKMGWAIGKYLCSFDLYIILSIFQFPPKINNICDSILFSTDNFSSTLLLNSKDHKVWVITDETFTLGVWPGGQSEDFLSPIGASFLFNYWIISHPFYFGNCLHCQLNRFCVSYNSHLFLGVPGRDLISQLWSFQKWICLEFLTFQVSNDPRNMTL